jgi:hypothetical protein
MHLQPTLSEPPQFARPSLCEVLGLRCPQPGPLTVESGLGRLIGLWLFAIFERLDQLFVLWRAGLMPAPATRPQAAPPATPAKSTGRTASAPRATARSARLRPASAQPERTPVRTPPGAVILPFPTARSRLATDWNPSPTPSAKNAPVAAASLHAHFVTFS